MSRSVANSCSRSKKAHVYGCVWVECRVKECVYIHLVDAISVVRCRLVCVFLSCVWSSVCSCFCLFFVFAPLSGHFFWKQPILDLNQGPLCAPWIFTNCKRFSMSKSQGDVKKVLSSRISKSQKWKFWVLYLMVKWVQLWAHDWMCTCTMSKLSL